MLDIYYIIISLPTIVACAILTCGVDLTVLTSCVNIFKAEDKTTEEVEAMFQLNSKPATYVFWCIIGIIAGAAFSTYVLHHPLAEVESFIIQTVLSILSCWYLVTLGNYHWVNRDKTQLTEQ